MIVCHCHVVTERQIRAQVREGAACVRSVAQACGAGTGCGGCLSLVEEIVGDEISSQCAHRGGGLATLDAGALR